MSMRSALLPLLMFVVAAPALAVRPRPVSDLRFDDRAFVMTAGAASDGSDFLVIGSSAAEFASMGDTTSRVVVQRVVNGVPFERQLAIANGIAIGIAWTGTHYLAAWRNGGVFVAPLTREGHLLAMPSQPVMPDDGSVRSWLFAANDRAAIVAGNAIQALDSNGAPAGPAKPLPHPSDASAWYQDIAAAGDGFALAFGGTRGVGVLRVGRDGTAQFPPLTVDANDAGDAVVAVTAAGDDAVIVYERFSSDWISELRAAVIDAHGAVTHAAHAVYSPPHSTVEPVKVVWDGSACVAVIGVTKDAPDGLEAPALIRISSAGERLGDVQFMVSNDDLQVPVALATNGRQLLPVWYEFRMPTVGYIGCRAAYISTPAMTGPLPRYLGRDVDVQPRVAVAAMDDRYLAVWYETKADSGSIRASRIDAAGNYLDGEGIVIATSPIARRWGWGPPIAVAGDGVNWLVVWADSRVHGARINADGKLLDFEPFEIAWGGEVAVAWNGARHVVASSDGIAVRVTLVSREGVVGASRVVATAPASSTNHTTLFDRPALAAHSGGDGLLIFARLDFVSDSANRYSNLVTPLGMRIDVTGAALDSPFPIGDSGDLVDNGAPAVATDGIRDLVVWTKGNDLTGVLLDARAPQNGGTPFLIDTAGVLPAAAFDGRDFLVAWRTSTGNLATTHVRGNAADPPARMPATALESTRGVSLAGSLIAFVSIHDAYDSAPRAGLLFDPVDGAMPAPSAPVITSAAHTDPDTVVATWQPVSGAFGIAIELGFADGSWRQIGVAPGSATTGSASLAGLSGVAIRLRAWNAAGESGASDVRFIAPHRVHAAGRR